MIGSGLKKLANENGMKVAHGVAYGNFRGFALTMCEGSGWKRLDFTTRFLDPAAQNAFQAKLTEVDLKKTYRVQALNIGYRSIAVVFHDTVGTMKKIPEFLDWFMPLLEECGAAKADICSDCGGQILGDDSWVLVDGVAHHMHNVCKEKVKSELAEAKQQEMEEHGGSYLSGAVGAFLGALVGALVWALILLAGHVASLVGLLIGFLAKFGYDLFKGKQGKGKMVILILAVIFGVVFGTLAADAIDVAMAIGSGEISGFVYGDIPALILFLLMEDAEYLRSVMANCGMGLVFAALGVFGLMRKTKQEVSGIRVIDL